jgi:hypothetical protein
MMSTTAHWDALHAAEKAQHELCDRVEERTHESVTPIPVDAYGIQDDVLASIQELTPAQRVDVAVMSLDQRKAVVRQALDQDAHEGDRALKMDGHKRHEAERWLRAVSGAVRP